MGEKQILILAFLGISAVAVFILFQQSSMTGQLGLVNMPSSMVIPGTPHAKTEAEICIKQAIPQNDKCRSICEGAQTTCKSTKDYCSAAYYYCDSNCGDGYTQQIKTCMKGMGKLL